MMLTKSTNICVPCMASSLGIPLSKITEMQPPPYSPGGSAALIYSFFLVLGVLLSCSRGSGHLKKMGKMEESTGRRDIMLRTNLSLTSLFCPSVLAVCLAATSHNL